MGWVGRAAAWRRVPPAVSDQPALLHAEKVVAADDEVVEYVDAHNFAGLYQAPRQVDVVLARRHVAGRVIMGEDHTRSGTALRRL